MRSNWLAATLELIADAAAEHPLLVGAVLALFLLSSILHIIDLSGRLLLGMIRYFRKQTADLQDLGFLYREEWAYWRQILDISRVRNMPSEQIAAELARKQLDVKTTTEIVTAVVNVLLLQQQNNAERHDNDTIDSTK